MKRRIPLEAELVEWAEIVLPWLSPPDLAAAAAACKALRREAAAVNARRASDASGGLENHPIPFLNPADTHPYSYFLYTRFPILGSSSSSPSPPPSSHPWGGARPPEPPSHPSFPPPFSFLSGGAPGCACEDCSSEGCPCWSVEAGLMSEPDAEMELITECGAHCGCGPECRNRLTQRGVSVRLRIVKDLNKGWGLHAAQALQRGEFVCEYAGEFLTTAEARRRQHTYDELASKGMLSPALLVVREHLPSGKACLRVNIDATNVGNVARFINHSCDGGNLSHALVRNSGSLLPRLCFFAAADIPEGEELTFSYGDANLKEKNLPCFCGSAACLGVLPSEDT